MSGTRSGKAGVTSGAGDRSATNARDSVVESAGPVQAPGIEWNEVWRSQMELRRRTSVRECAEIWTDPDSARHYWRAATESNAEYIEQTTNGIRVEKHFHVLDVGAGPGNMAIPLASRVARLTAVEPAAGMADVLEEKAREHGVGNITCIRKRWEDVDPHADLDVPFDVVVASFSLGMTDLAGAIRKMVQVARGTVYLIWFAGTTNWELMYRDLWPRLHGQPYHPGPKADVLFNVLYQMDIYPHTTVFPYRGVLRFRSMDEAAEEFGRRLNATEPEQFLLVRDVLESRMERDGNDLVLPHTATCVKFWWPVETMAAS